MSEVLSQSDLDALFGGGAPQKDESSGLSQSDLDALFGDITSAQGTETAETGGPPETPGGLDLMQTGEEPGREAGAPSSSGSETMSQDDIDKLLAEFLG